MIDVSVTQKSGKHSWAHQIVWEEVESSLETVSEMESWISWVRCIEIHVEVMGFVGAGPGFLVEADAVVVDVAVAHLVLVDPPGIAEEICFLKEIVVLVMHHVVESHDYVGFPMGAVLLDQKL